MRLGAWLGMGSALLVAVSAGACSADYPLPPTPCDDWCDATQGMMCEDYRPASCVSMCEKQDLDRSECRQAFDAVVDCFRRTPGAAEQQCEYDPYLRRACLLENEALFVCTQF